jgi:hypothetical protein
MKLKRGRPAEQQTVPAEKRTYQPTGLYKRLDELDGRTTTAKVIQVLRRELQAYVGESTIACEILINRIIYKHLRLTAYENTWIENPKHEEKQHYIPLANSLRLDLATLKEMSGQRKPPPDLHSYVKDRYHEVKGRVGGDE